MPEVKKWNVRPVQEVYDTLLAKPEKRQHLLDRSHAHLELIMEGWIKHNQDELKDIMRLQQENEGEALKIIGKE